jgi:hypothetical protein
MPGGRIGQVDAAVALASAATVQVPAGQGHLPQLLSVQPDGQGAGIGVESGDGAASAVGHPQFGDGVAAAHHPVPNGQLAALDLQPIGAEAAAGGQQLLAGHIEPIDLGPTASEHDHVLGRVPLGLLPGLPPVLEQGQGGGRLGLRAHDPVVGPVGGHRLLDQAGADQLEGFAFPGLVLAAVLGELSCAEPQPQGAEAAAGVDRRQLPIISDQDHLGSGVLGVLEQAGQLAAAEHAGLVHHQHRPPIQALSALVEVGQEPVAGGHLLEPLTLQAHGGDPGGSAGQRSVAVQLPGMAGCAEGEGLACPGPAHDQGNAGATLTDVPDHGLLVLAGGGMRLEGGPDRLVGHHGRLLLGATGGRGDQPLLHGQELRGGPAALLQRPVRHHGHGPLGTEPVSQALELGSTGARELAAEGSEHVLAGECGGLCGQSVRTCQPLEHLGHRRLGQTLVAVACPAAHLSDQGVRVVAAFGRLCPPPSIQGVRGLVVFGLAGGMDGPFDQPGCPLPPVRLEPLHLQVDLAGALGEGPHQVLGQALELAVPMGVRCCPLDPERPRQPPLVGRPIDRVRGQPVPVKVPAVQRCPASVRPLGPVGHHQVGVQQRVTLPGRPMVEPNGEQPLSGHVLVSTVTTPGPRCPSR